MIKTYGDGNALFSENKDFLRTNEYLSSFFALDAPLLKKQDSKNYALCAEACGKKLLAMKVEPYALLLFGSEDVSDELALHLFTGDYEVKAFLCGEDVGERFSEIAKEKYGIEFCEALAMDFMEANEVTEPSSDEVEIPTENDLDEIVCCLSHFISDCGLLDKVDREMTARTLGNFRIIKADGKIVSMTKIMPSTSTSLKIADVYTRPEYRGKGFARKVVNTAKNEILASGKTAVLNVDKKNPISNRLYASLGFVRVFSQGEYRQVKKEVEA